VDNTGTSTGNHTAIQFDQSGVPWVSFNDITNTSLRVAKLHTPPGPLSYNRGGELIPSGDLRYRLTDGRSSRLAYNGTCGTVTATNMGYCGVFDNQGDYDSIITGANEMPMYAGAVQFIGNTILPNIIWEGRTSLAPNTGGTTGDIYLQVYRFGSTNSWETIASNTASADCNTVDCTLSGSPTGTPSQYFETDGSEYWIYFRVYQEETSSSITFKTDKLSATTAAQRLRGGRVFEGGVTKPLFTE
jgi:hypothetical protein